jgi:uncharacterized protein (TIGR02391 family)
MPAAEAQNTKQDRVPILAFIRYAMKPESYARLPGRYDPMRARLNRALLFAGLKVEANGELVAAEAAQTLSEAQRRANELRADLEIVGVHSEILRFCREELLAENYFHAVLEAAKSIADRLRERTGLSSDGAVLVDQALGGNPPLLVINAWETETDKSEQRGFANLVKGVFAMFRNPTAHAPKSFGPSTRTVQGRRFPSYRSCAGDSTTFACRRGLKEMINGISHTTIST